MIDRFEWKHVWGCFSAWLVVVLLASFFIAVHLGRAGDIEINCWGNEEDRWCAVYRDGEFVEAWNVDENRKTLKILRSQLEALGPRGRIAIDLAENPNRWTDL